MTRRMLLAQGCAVLGLPFAAWASVEEARKKIKDGKYEEAITQLEGELKANPKSAELRKALADAHFAYGESLMYGKEPPMKKYPGALREFRRVQELDPENAKAHEHIDTIEAIYKSMGRPVPK